MGLCHRLQVFGSHPNVMRFLPPPPPAVNSLYLSVEYFVFREIWRLLGKGNCGMAPIVKDNKDY